MTLVEFNRQIWRRYDKVELDNGITGKVMYVCFTHPSVKVMIRPKEYEWFGCESIVRHIPLTAEPDDLAMIENLHFKLMEANKRNEELQVIVKDLQDRLKADPDMGMRALRKMVNDLNSFATTKRKVLERTVSACDRLNKWLDERLGKEE